MNLRRISTALLVLSLLGLAGCAKQQTSGSFKAPGSETASSAPAARAGTVIFDMSHGEVFGPRDQSQLGQSTLVSEVQASGYNVKVNQDKLTTESLAGVAAVYVPGPMMPFTDAEKKALDQYLVNGGTVILTIHVPYPVMATPARWGLPVGTGVMMSTKPAYSDPGIFAATQIADHELTKGVKSVMVVSGFSLSTDPTKLADAQAVVTAGPEVVVDGNNDGKFDASDPQPPYGVVGVAPVGSGRVIVMGDDAVFANLAINEADNLKLLRNILGVISAPKGA